MGVFEAYYLREVDAMLLKCVENSLLAFLQSVCCLGWGCHCRYDSRLHGDGLVFLRVS